MQYETVDDDDETEAILQEVIMDSDEDASSEYSVIWPVLQVRTFKKILNFNDYVC